MHSILDSMFGSIFGWFVLPTWIPWTQFGTSGLAPNAFFRVFWEIDVWSHFGANLAHFGIQNPPKSMKKSIPRGIQKMIDFWIDFLLKLAPFWDPSWDPRAAQDGPKTPPRFLKNFPRRHQDSSRATRASKIEIWSIFGPKIRWGTPPVPRFSSLCESRCLFRAALYTSPPNTQSPANFHPLDILVQINPQSTWGPNKLARRYKGEAFYNILDVIYVSWNPCFRALCRLSAM